MLMVRVCLCLFWKIWWMIDRVVGIISVVFIVNLVWVVISVVVLGVKVVYSEVRLNSGRLVRNSCLWLRWLLSKLVLGSRLVIISG